MTSQDIVKGIDITALVQVSGSEMNQLVDAGRLADDKGMFINTTDSALNTPVVPNPDVTLEGVIPTFWKRYTWKRYPFDATGQVIEYSWNELQPVDPVYLNWVSTSVDTTSLQNQVTAIDAEIATLQQNVASNTANIAVNNNTIQEVDQNFDTLAAQVSSDVATLTALMAQICPPGSYRWDASATPVTGWLLCDGTSYLRSTYPNLFGRIGTTYGNVDTTHFNVPFVSSRGLIAVGQGTGLSSRVLGQMGGEETHLLTGAQSGSKAHTHNVSGLYAKVVPVGFDIGGSHPVTTDNVDGAVTLTTDANTASNATDPLSLMNPFLGAYCYIKT